MQSSTSRHRVLKKQPLKVAVEAGVQTAAGTIYITDARKCFSIGVNTYLQALKVQ